MYDAPHRLKTAEAAQFLGLAESTLEHWRCAGCGPVFYRIGRRITYALPDLEEFAAAQRRTSTSTSAPADGAARSLQP